MAIDRCWYFLKKEFSRVEISRADDFDAILRYMMIISDDIVDEYKQYREDDKKSDSRFRFWTYVPSVERGSSSVVIRWRKYTGRGRRSDPVPTSTVKDHQLPISQFYGCTRAEKRAIVNAESRFAKIRKLNLNLLAINRAQNALVDIVGGRDFCESKTSEKTALLEESVMCDSNDVGEILPVKEFTEADRLAVRKKVGANPVRYS
jgi:hypothetical protein